MPRAWTLAAGLLVLVGCHGLTPQQRAWLAEGQSAYRRQQFSRAIQQLSRFLGEVKQHPQAARALYVRAMSHARHGNRRAAYADLARCLETADESDVLWRARVVLGTLHFEDGRWRAAGDAFSAAASRMPPVPPLDTVLYRIGLCHERTGRWAAAREPYQQIVKRFGRSTLADAAQRRLRLNADHYAIQCGAYARSRNAENRAIELRRKKLSAYVRREPRGRRMLYVVHVGRYASYADARRQLAAVRKHVPDAILWP